MAQAHPILDKSGFNPDKKLKIVGSSPVKHDGLDKVTGRAKFGADMFLPGMLVGKILRSPHPHAIIKSIDTSAAEKLPGVKAVICRARFPGDQGRHRRRRHDPQRHGARKGALRRPSGRRGGRHQRIDRQGRAEADQGRLRAAAARHRPGRGDEARRADPARSRAHQGRQGRGQAVKRGRAPTSSTWATPRPASPRPTSSSSASSTPSRCTRATSSRRPASPRPPKDGQIELWCCTQAPWVFRDRLSNILKIETAKIRVQQSEMGGGFGGKTGFYPEPIAIQLSRKAKRPVKIMLTRNEVFRATGPVSGTKSRIKIGCKKDGTITAAEAELFFQTGCFTGSAFTNAPQAMFTRYALKNVKTTSYEIVSNRPKVNSFRAPCVPQIVFGVEGVISELAAKIGMDGIDFRLKNAAVEGYKTIYGDVFGPDRLRADAGGGEEVRPLHLAGAGGLRPRHCRRLLVQPRRRDHRHAQHRHRRLGDAHSRHHRRRGLAHLHLDDGGGGARHPGRQGARGDGRHPLARLQPRHRGLPHHLLHRHGDRRFRAQGDQRAVQARRRHLGRAGGRRHLRGRLLQARKLQRRQLRAAVDRADRRQDHGDRTAPSPAIRR